jgi:hypothetical protein
MPTSVGPNPSADSNIVFSYDVGDTSNSYIGEPTTNTVGNLNSYNPLDLYTWASTGNTSTWSRDTTIFPSPVNGIPLKELSFGTDSYSDTYNTTQDNISAASSGQTWTISVYALAAAGTNLQVWIFGANASGNYIELDARNFTATGVWQRISISMTFTNGSTAYVQSRVATATNGATVWWDGLQVEQKTNPTQFTTGTRSATQGLLPLLGNTSINLSNVSFDSNAQIVFDGTDDYIVTTTSIPCNFGTGDFTIEVMIYPQSFISYTHMVALPDQNTFALKADIGNGIIYYYDPSFTTYGSTSGWTLTLNQWNHVVLVRSGNVAYAYLNGASKGSKTGFNTNLSSTQIVNIGNGGTLEHTPKKINLVKIYNTALTANQVQQNYRQYKSRFNLS